MEKSLLLTTDIGKKTFIAPSAPSGQFLGMPLCVINGLMTESLPAKVI